MQRLVVSPDEIAEIQPRSVEPSVPSAGLSPPIPWWAKISMSPLVLVLPVLCVLSIILRIAMRNLEPRVRIAWLAFLSTLLAVSGVLTSIAGVLAFTLSPSQPSVLSQGLSELDSRTSFPTLNADHDLSAEEVADDFKPLVTVITPIQHGWFSRVDSPSTVFGAGVVLECTRDGYLIATARHVIDGESVDGNGQRALVASTSGAWATADVVARHRDLDLLLLWLPRAVGHANFTMPVAEASQIKDGAPIFVIGHPQGLRFTLSTGIVSRKDQDTIQITAPVSPGNSGGPVFDARGKLAGIVTSMVDRSRSPNAESLNFAVRADALLDLSRWTFFGDGRHYLSAFEKDQHVVTAEKEN